MEFQDNSLQLLPPLSSRSDGPYCPSEILAFTCIGVAIPLVLDWTVNNAIIATYIIRPSDELPKVIYSTDNVTITMEYAIAVSRTEALYYNITSVLTGTATYLQGYSLRCESSIHRSNTFQIRVQGKIFSKTR